MNEEIQDISAAIEFKGWFLIQLKTLMKYTAQKYCKFQAHYKFWHDPDIIICQGHSLTCQISRVGPATSKNVPLFSAIWWRCMMLRISSLTAWALPPLPHVDNMHRTHSWASPPVIWCVCMGNRSMLTEGKFNRKPVLHQNSLKLKAECQVIFSIPHPFMM